MRLTFYCFEVNSVLAFPFLRSRRQAGYSSSFSQLSIVRLQQALPTQEKSVSAKKRNQVSSSAVSTTEGELISHGCLACQEANEIVRANLWRVCVNATQLRETDLSLFTDFANDESEFRVTVAQMMQDVFSSTVTQEQKKRSGIKQMNALALLYHIF